MQFRRIPSLLLALVIGVVAFALWFGLLRAPSPAVAQEVALSAPRKIAPRMQAPPDYELVAFVVFTDPAVIEVMDLSGNVIGEGQHQGAVRCSVINCSGKIQLHLIGSTSPLAYEYKFRTPRALDPEAESLVVAGTGTISDRGQKERFLFTATFQNNRDGTVSVTYVASRPDASFRIAAAPGAFTITRRR